ncbi:hypothetical protein, partial [Brucella anthropi]|uniref:hypothetical protein n=1 Tax=Brucella anthropi TaxID=529 RepID=UPI001F1990E5
VVVTNATLHNEDYIKGIGLKGERIRADEHDIRVGDTVIVQRAGAPDLNVDAAQDRRSLFCRKLVRNGPSWAARAETEPRLQ